MIFDFYQVSGLVYLVYFCFVHGLDYLPLYLGHFCFAHGLFAAYSTVVVAAVQQCSSGGGLALPVGQSPKARPQQPLMQLTQPRQAAAMGAGVDKGVVLQASDDKEEVAHAAT